MVMPKALLIGKAPDAEYGFIYTEYDPYDAVVIGSISSEQLLQMPSDCVCDALLKGLPVYYWPNQLFRKAKHGRLLQKELERAEQKLREIGIRFLSEPGPFLTVQSVQRLLDAGKPLPVGCRMSPLAKELWEARMHDRWNRNGKLLGDKKM